MGSLGRWVEVEATSIADVCGVSFSLAYWMDVDGTRMGKG